MTDIRTYGDQYRWVQETIANLLGVNIPSADAGVRGLAAANAITMGTLAKTLVENGVITNTQLEEVWNEAVNLVYSTIRLDPVNFSGIRYNLCDNPALANNATGWDVDGGTGTRTAVSGFDRPNVYRLSGGVFILAPEVEMSEGEVWTYSCWFQRGAVSTAQNINVYVNFFNGAAFHSSSLKQEFLIPTVTPTQLSVTVTAPTNATSFRLVIETPTSTGTYDATMAVAEMVDTVREYFDGDTDGARWDGTAGNSTSTWDTTVLGTAVAQVAEGSGTARNGFAGAVFPPAATGSGVANNADPTP